MIEIPDNITCMTIETPQGPVRHCGTREALNQFCERVNQMWEDAKTGYFNSFAGDPHKYDNRVKEDPKKVLERYATPKKRNTSGSYNR